VRITRPESRRTVADNQHGEDVQQAKKTIEEAQSEITPAPTPDKVALDEARGVRAVSQTETPEEQRGREYYAATIQLNAEWTQAGKPILENLDATTMGGVDSLEKAQIAMQAVNSGRRLKRKGKNTRCLAIPKGAEWPAFQPTFLGRTTPVSFSLVPSVGARARASAGAQ
jgi:hypothetical protein